MNGLIDPKSIPLSAEAPAGQQDTLTKHLNCIVQECCHEFETLEAVILYGGYGRGEGSWIEDGDNWLPYNDYDVVVIVRKKAKADRVVKLRVKLAKMLGIRWVDLSQKTPAQMKWLRPSIYNYDLRNASTTIYGSKKFCESIPFIKASKLPLGEILTLFCTRLWPFMGALGQDGFAQGLSDKEACFFRNQMAKATLAAVDVILLLEGDYDASYRVRVNRACKNPLVSTDDIDLFRWAIGEKLFPLSPKMSGCEVTKLYNKVYKLFSRVMYKGLSTYFGREIVNVYQLEKAYRRNFSTIIYRVLYPLLKQSLKFEKVMLSNIVQFYLFAAYQVDGQVDTNLLRNANYYLLKIKPTLSKSMSWSEACDAIATIRNNL